jgi:predicted dehydrogenase
LDYPYAFVRWTENRNMGEYLRLIRAGFVAVEPLVNGVYPIERSLEAFELLQNPVDRPLIVLLEYSGSGPDDVEEFVRPIRSAASRGSAVPKDRINVALIGAGGFANSVHLPNMRKLGDKFRLRCVMDKAGFNAKTTAGDFGADYATTDYEAILADADVDLVFICTRHDSHENLVIRGLRASKNVFVEKPLATSVQGMDAIRGFYAGNHENAPVLLVGFNRRFSRYAQEIKARTDGRKNPLMMRYRMNAGYIPYDHWVHESGGRIVGEACHMIDFCGYLAGSAIKSIGCESLAPSTGQYQSSDNKAITIAYSDGSVAVIEYFSVGSKNCPKERFEVDFDGKSIVLDDFLSLKGYGLRMNELKSPTQEKGHFEELESLHATLSGKSPSWPIDLEDMLQTTEAALLISRDTGDISMV